MWLFVFRARRFECNFEMGETEGILFRLSQPWIFSFYDTRVFRACSRSPEQEGEECKVNELQAGIEVPFAVSG